MNRVKCLIVLVLLAIIASVALVEAGYRVLSAIAQVVERHNRELLRGE